MKNLFSYKSVKLWTILTAVLLVLIVVVDVLAFQVFYEPIVMALGGRRPVYEDGVEAYYVAETESKAEALENAQEVSVEACEEGFVLLRNEDGALPLAGDEKISVFGKNSVNLVYGNSGSSAGDLDDAKTLYESLREAGFTVNPELEEFYENDSLSGEGRSDENDDLDSGEAVTWTTGETPYSSYEANGIPSSYASYNDAAVVVFSRMGGEGADLPKTMADDADSHYLELDTNEKELLTEVTAAFDTVIVVINSSNAMELGFVEDGTYGEIDACIWIGAPGGEGITALGSILNGEVNPSGHTADTYAADFKADPTWSNFGYDDYAYDLTDDDGSSYYFTQYEEGIYMGYRYYETAWAEAENGNYDGFDYDEAVVYPFGYGLSYTDFEWEIVEDNISGKNIEADRSYTVTVRVTNTGSVPGKDVVEMYCSAPYASGGIEKAYKVLCGYGKTPMLYPSEENAADPDDAADGSKKPNACELTLTFTPYDVASYDCDDANGNGFCGYELEAGEYGIFLSTDAHTDVITLSCQAAEDLRYETDPDTGETVENRFEDADDRLGDTLSRSDFAGTWPEAPTSEEMTADQDLIDSLFSTKTNNTEADGSTMPEQGVTYDETVTLRDLMYDAETGDFNGEVDYDDERWEELLNQLTVSEMADLVNKGCFKSESIERIGKPETIDTDGPSGFTNFIQTGLVYDVCVYPSEVILASTWNTEILYEIGSAMGEEGIWGNTEKDGYPYSGIYAPGANLHRSPFGGRNGEYFSEDSYLTGMCAASEINGAAEKGLYMTIKHFAINEQESRRSVSGLVNWIDEQTMRELYLKGFEKAVKNSDATAVMSSFTRTGTTWAGGDYRLLTEVLRNEWGFRGMVISDFNTNVYMNNEQMIYAGGDLNLSSTRFWTKYDSTDAADVTVLRNATKNILYTVVNSNAMNGTITGYRMPTWMMIAIVTECVLGAAAVGSGIAVFVKAAKRRKAEA